MTPWSTYRPTPWTSWQEHEARCGSANTVDFLESGERGSRAATLCRDCSHRYFEPGR